MANNQYVNKVQYGNNTLIDLTGDTVTAASLLQGYTAHDASGAPITGTISCPWPVGAVLQMTNATDPNNVYPGTTWSEIQGVFLLGSSSSHTLGTTGGAESVTLSSANLPSHAHSYDKADAESGSTVLTVDQIPAHGHSFNTGGGNGSSGGKYVVAWGTSPLGLSGFTKGSTKSDAINNTGGGQGHTHTVSTSSATSGNTGSGSAVSTMPPYKVVNMWERTA